MLFNEVQFSKALIPMISTEMPRMTCSILSHPNNEYAGISLHASLSLKVFKDAGLEAFDMSLFRMIKKDNDYYIDEDYSLG